jgi:hypothetical protein
MTIMLLITIAAVVVAFGATLVAWRTMREARRRSAARVAALSDAIHAEPPSLFGSRGASPGDLPLRAPAAAPDLPLRATAPQPTLFAAAEVERPRSRLAAAIALSLLIVGTAAALVVVFGSPSGIARERLVPDTSQPAIASEPPAAPPLELLALDQVRRGSELVVSGIVRNPSDGTPLDHVAAVAFLFDAAGGFVTSARAGLGPATLAAGTDAPFSIAVPDASDVARYRVSFRVDDRIIPHVDRRPVPQQVRK